jgi:general L-amino acid transport system substrate-binding protein
MIRYQGKAILGAFATLAALVTFVALPAHAGKTLDSIKARGQIVCGVNTGLAGFSRSNNLALKQVVFESLDGLVNAYFAGRCVGYTTDASGLASVRNKEAKNPDDHVILPTLISKEPLGPMGRRGDDEWFAIVKWVI